MADLNDFFARKDKNKPKNMKFTTLNNIDKKLKEMDLKKEKAQRLSSDDEWKRFEEKKIDYTGLKIQNCTLEEEDCGVESERDDESSCPWSAVQSQGNVEVQETPIAKDVGCQKVWKTIETPVQQEKPLPKVKAYVPPHLRNKPAAATTGTGRFNKVKGLRDENVENMFPSLPSTGSASIWESKFKVHEPSVSSSNPLKLTLENKFDALNSRSD